MAHMLLAWICRQAFFYYLEIVFFFGTALRLVTCNDLDFDKGPVSGLRGGAGCKNTFF